MRENEFIRILDPQGGFLLVYKNDVEKFIVEDYFGLKRIVGRKPLIKIDLEASEEEFQNQLSVLAEKIEEVQGI
jgi:hypothetical protein